MKTEITNKQLEVIKTNIQEVINGSLDAIRKESEEWGLGEMDEINELESIDKIVIDRVVPYVGLTVYVKLYINNERDEFDNILSELNYRVQKWLPNVIIFIDSII
jgi:hypothetical protein